MEVMYRDQHGDAVARRPSGLDLWAAGLLVAAVVLHLVAMFPPYFGGSIGEGSVWSQPDQAALYAVVTAGWALALALVLSGPGRVRLGAALAAGLAITELGFRVGDVGEALHFGVGGSSTGVWLMTAGWVAGAAGAIVAVMAVRRRARVQFLDAATSDPAPAWDPAPGVMTAWPPPGPSPSAPGWAPPGDPRWSAAVAQPPQADPGWTPPGALQPPPDPQWSGAPTLPSQPDPQWSGAAARQPPPDPRWAAPDRAAPGAPLPQRDRPDPRWVSPAVPPPRPDRPDPRWAPAAPQPGPDPGWAAPPGLEPRSTVDPTPANPWAPPSLAPAGVAGPVEAGGEGRSLPAPVEPTAALPVETTAAAPVEPTAAGPVETTAAVSIEPTTPLPVGQNGEPREPTASLWVDASPGVAVDAATRVPAVETAPSGPYGARLTGLVAFLGLITAGAFLPAWDRYVGVVTTSGRTVSFNLGNAFSGPWPLVLGNVLVAVALVGVPVLGSRLRDRAVAGWLVVGSLLVLASQFTAAIVQVNQPVPPSVAGLTPAQAAQLGLELHLSLTGWFTLDVLAAYGLFVAVMVIGYLRPAPAHETSAQENSAGTWPSAPAARNPASLPWS